MQDVALEMTLLAEREESRSRFPFDFAEAKLLGDDNKKNKSNGKEHKKGTREGPLFFATSAPRR